MARGASAPTPVCVLLGHACCSEAFQRFRAGVWKRNPRDRPGHLPSGPSSAALRFGGLCRLRIPGRRPAPRRVRLRAAPPLPLLRRRSPRLGSAFLHGPPSVPRGGCCGVRLRLAGVDQQTRRFSVSQLRLNFPLPEAGAPFSGRQWPAPLVRSFCILPSLLDDGLCGGERRRVRCIFSGHRRGVPPSPALRGECTALRRPPPPSGTRTPVSASTRACG